MRVGSQSPGSDFFAVTNVLGVEFGVERAPRAIIGGKFDLARDGYFACSN
jgi:hypothetical protein